MVCPRCIKVVGEELNRLDFEILHIELGKVEVLQDISPEQTESFRKALADNGFELLSDKKNQTVDNIKTLIINRIHNNEGLFENKNLSDWLATETGYDYRYLSHLFSQTEQLTIEKYVILQKIERIKELLSYHEQSLKEIAFSLGYSSVQHLSAQFKKTTGFTPSEYRQQNENLRKSLDNMKA